MVWGGVGRVRIIQLGLEMVCLDYTCYECMVFATPQGTKP